MTKNAVKNVKLAIVVPVYNEQEILSDLFKRLDKLAKDLNKKGVEVFTVFVNDGSKDKSQEILEKYVVKKGRSTIGVTKLTPPHKIVIKFTKNFGHQAALKAGFDWVIQNTDANYIVSIDADLQDPPELIKDMLEKAIRKDYDIVYAKRDAREEEKAKVLTADAFYWFLQKITSSKVEAEVADFRLVKRNILETALKHATKPLFWRGLFATITDNVGYVLYNRKTREKGKTKYTILKMLKLAIAGVITMGDKIPVYIGYGFLVLTGLAFLALLTGGFSYNSCYSYGDSCVSFEGAHFLVNLLIWYFVMFIGGAVTFLAWYAYGLISKNQVIYVVDKVVEVGDNV